jgi:copper chaperone CopZ
MFRILPRRILQEPRAQLTDVVDEGSSSKATLHIQGLVCSACASNVQRSIERVSGVQAATVDLDTGEASVRFESSVAAPEALVGAVQRAVVFPKARSFIHRLAHGR